MKSFSDLLNIDESGKLHLQDGIHHLEDLLELSPKEILEHFRKDQVSDFLSVIESSKNIKERIEKETFTSLDLPYLQQAAFKDLFLELHEHVMSHPVWLHPFFLRIFQGDISTEQIKTFSLNYFNQIKNTRQCVALSLGRFNGLMGRSHGQATERVIELAQIVLSQLVADEYGVGTHTVDEYPKLENILESRTHIVMYRNLFDGIGIPFNEQDIPLTHGVADNVLIQRILAGNDRFSELESLASVGLGMEWGVPEFFSLILGGLIRAAYKQNIQLTQEHLFVFIAHVRYDVMHAISVMFITAFFIRYKSDIQRVKGAVNTLMAGRYGMMTDLYSQVFGENCQGIHEINIDDRYKLTDRRMEEELLAMRKKVSPDAVVNADSYSRSTVSPFVYL